MLYNTKHLFPVASFQKKPPTVVGGFMSLSQFIAYDTASLTVIKPNTLISGT